MKKTRKYHSLEYKKKLVDEYVGGTSTAEAIAAREQIDRAMLYKWKAQLENKARDERADELSAAGYNADDVRRIMELEDELAAAKIKIADQALAIDLLKKIQPNFQSEKKSSGYAELKQSLASTFKRRLK